MSTGIMMKGALFGVALAATMMTGTARVEAAACLNSDVSFTINYPPSVTYNPSSCANMLNAGAGPSNPAAETTAINAAFGTSLVFLDSTDSASAAGIGGGIVFSVTAPTNTSSGTFNVTWVDTAAAAPNFPLLMDLAVYLKGGNADDAAYLIEDVLLQATPNSGTGQFMITFLNAGQQIPNLSHMSIFGGNLSTPPNPGPVPEPATLALFGVGLAGLGALARRRRRV